MVYQIYSSMVEHLTNFKGVWLDYLLIILAYHILGFNLAFHTYSLFFLNTNLNYKSVIVYLTELVIVIIRCVIIVKVFFRMDGREKYT